MLKINAQQSRDPLTHIYVANVSTNEALHH
jgi:hypothetical protein